MRVLLDENMPVAIANCLPGHDIFHVDDLGIKSYRNGKLLAHARENHECLITLDRGILFQHNHEGQTLAIIVLRVPNSRKQTILGRSSDLASCLEAISPGEHVEI